MRTGHQGGQACPYLDQALLHEVHIQPGPSRAVRVGVQPRQFHAPLRPPERGLALVAIQHPAQAPEDRGQDYQSLQDDHISDGGGCGTREAVPVDAIQNSPPGEGMRESTRLEPVKDGDGKAGCIQMRDNCPRMTGKREAWREDARVGSLEGGGTGFRASERTFWW